MKLAYERWGEGSHPLVLLHGFTGNRSAWEPVRPHLAAYFSAIAVDLPGHGESPPPEGFEETLDALAELPFERADLLGYSQGARIALGFAVRHPHRVRRLILESGSPGLRHRRERAERRRADEAIAAEIERDGVEAFVARWEALPLFASLRALAPQQGDALRARRRSCSVEGLAGALRKLGLGAQPSYWDNLHRLRVPTLVISGGRDPKFTEIARKMAGQLSLAWRCVLDTGHAPHLEEPAAYAREVLAFAGAHWTESSQTA
jgi:2-succinyl-6-hydroxy-2,4-cyclohexadiene-1-carboxylate synthase